MTTEQDTELEALWPAASRALDTPDPPRGSLPNAIAGLVAAVRAESADELERLKAELETVTSERELALAGRTLAWLEVTTLKAEVVELEEVNAGLGRNIRAINPGELSKENQSLREALSESVATRASHAKRFREMEAELNEVRGRLADMESEKEAAAGERDDALAEVLRARLERSNRFHELEIELAKARKQLAELAELRAARATVAACYREALLQLGDTTEELAELRARPVAEKRKVVAMQTLAGHHSKTGPWHLLYALCDDGKIWCREVGLGVGDSMWKLEGLPPESSGGAE